MTADDERAELLRSYIASLEQDIADLRREAETAPEQQLGQIQAGIQIMERAVTRFRASL
jgi:hypothetical protein